MALDVVLGKRNWNSITLLEISKIVFLHSLFFIKQRKNDQKLIGHYLIADLLREQ